MKEIFNFITMKSVELFDPKLPVGGMPATGLAGPEEIAPGGPDSMVFGGLETP